MQMRRLVAAANAVRWANPALRADSLDVTHEDHDNHILAFIRETDDNVVLVIVNLGDRTYGDHEYGVRTGGRSGRWTEVLCSQDADSADGTAQETRSPGPGHNRTGRSTSTCQSGAPSSCVAPESPTRVSTSLAAVCPWVQGWCATLAGFPVAPDPAAASLSTPVWSSSPTPRAPRILDHGRAALCRVRRAVGMVMDHGGGVGGRSTACGGAAWWSTAYLPRHEANSAGSCSKADDGCIRWRSGVSVFMHAACNARKWSGMTCEFAARPSIRTGRTPRKVPHASQESNTAAQERGRPETE
jgi:hypothetical protein